LARARMAAERRGRRAATELLVGEGIRDR
jgi:hypothetical protein